MAAHLEHDVLRARLVPPHLGEARIIRLMPQSGSSGVFRLLGEIVGDARLFYSPARRRAESGPPQSPLDDERDNLVDLDAEQLGNLRGREESRSRCGRIGHVPIVALVRHAPVPLHAPVDNF